MGGGISPFLNIFGNIGNRSITNTRDQAIANIFDVSGAFTNTYAGLGGAEAQQTMGYVEGGEPAPVAEAVVPETIIPEDPAIAQAATSEKARQEEMRKRRMRTKTLLSDQEDTGTATVGTKVLLGG